MSEDAAFRRSKAARLVHQHPELRDVVARGEIHLTGLLMIAPYLGGYRQAEVLERARFRSKREIARLIAEIDPKPEVPPSIEPISPSVHRPPTAEALAQALAGPVRSLSAGDRPGDWIADDRDTEAAGVQSRTSQDLAEAAHALGNAAQAQSNARPERPLLYKVRFTAGQEYVDLLEEAFDLLGFGRKAAGLPEVQLRALRELVERLRKRKRGAPARVSETTGVTAPARATEMTPLSRSPRSSRGRYIPVAARRAVWPRDGSRCAYVDARGHRCSETRGLEVHHREAHALGGPATEDNLELRCRAHNVLAAEQDFGREHVEYMMSYRE